MATLRQIFLAGPCTSERLLLTTGLSGDGAALHAVPALSAPAYRCGPALLVTLLLIYSFCSLNSPAPYSLSRFHDKKLSLSPALPSVVNGVTQE